ncbi:hypothetical protein HFZ78_17510 [Priestia megaterium]|uniref:Uncharacterized protein n=1 Tax=Priestia megaterium TaxID=1404 RepID=A0A6H1P452_PRIMG|nr:hypothetical protein [Priestia megaterium]QIZ08298.1 hypothetical protein HFZ78_17510 [Priestia megaterium]
MKKLVAIGLTTGLLFSGVSNIRADNLNPNNGQHTGTIIQEVANLKVKYVDSTNKVFSQNNVNYVLDSKNVEVKYNPASIEYTVTISNFDYSVFPDYFYYAIWDINPNDRSSYWLTGHKEDRDKKVYEFTFSPHFPNFFINFLKDELQQII